MDRVGWWQWRRLGLTRGRLRLVAVLLWVTCTVIDGQLCDLSGNWTSSHNNTPPTDIVHIEFFQEPGNASFTLRATPWGSVLSHGKVESPTEVSLYMVGNPTPQTLTVSGNPPCSTLSAGWCKFPYCGFPEPHWAPWSPPTPIPPPPVPPVPPKWKPNWNFTESTTIQPSSSSWFMPNHTWGLISLDWSVATDIWYKNGRNRTNCEAVSTEGCRMLKDAGKASKCFIYHNMELALEWEESQRKVMYNPATADYFLQYTDGMGHKNGTIYAENIVYGDQFFWDYTNPDAAQYFIDSVVESLDDPAVDGTFTDDVTGVPAEHEHVMERINMTDTQLLELQHATTATHAKLVTKLIAAGKFNWQAFGGGDGAGPSISHASCITFMKSRCTSDFQSQPLMMSASEPMNQSVAAFLIIRPPIGFFGYGWESDDKNWNDIFLLQAGEPTEICVEESPGVFSRTWSNGKASLDCNKYIANLPFPSL